MKRDGSAFDGSIGDFKSISVMKRLKVYAFIIATLRGDNTFMGDALLEDVRAIRDRRSKPIVFFLDEFPRVGDQFTGATLDTRTALVRSMRNVFRFLRLPHIISATNGTARRLVSVSTYSRPLSGDPVPWCTMVPSLPRIVPKPDDEMEEILDTSVFEWIIQNSRPLFGALAKDHMRQFPFSRSGQDQLGYLTTMVKALTPKFRDLKLRKRKTEFEKCQLYLFLGSSYNVNNKRIGKPEITHRLGVEGMETDRPRRTATLKSYRNGVPEENDSDSEDLDDEKDEDYVQRDDDDDDECKEDSDKEMPEAVSESDESSKEVNLIDGHYGRMEEQDSFELEWGIEDLVKNKKVWKCRCVFPQPTDDILLYLTLIGDYEDTEASRDSESQLRLALPNNKSSPLDRPFYKKLRDVLGQNGITTRNTAQDTNDGMSLETLAVGAIVLASHQGGFYGIKFKSFFGRLLYELGVRISNEPVTVPGNTEIEKSTIPFLSPPNVAWPNEFLEFWKNTPARFATMERCRNSDKIDFTAHSGLLTGECKDRKKLTLSMLKHALEVIPSTTKIHLVVVKKLQEIYFKAPKSESANPSESVAERKDATSQVHNRSLSYRKELATVPSVELQPQTQATSPETSVVSTSSETKRPKADPNESASSFLERVKLQHAKFYCISRGVGRTLKEFPELMEARQDPPLGEMRPSAGGAGMTIIFIEVGN